MRERKKLKDVFQDPLTSGIFTSLQALDVPWKGENIAGVLDLSFISNYGARKISPLVEACLDENGKLTSQKQALVASAVYNLNKVNWIKQYNTLLFEYNPIENYSMVETHSGTDTVTDTPNNWKQTETQKPTNWKETETQTPTDWKETQTQTPTNWKETETQTPTNWTETETQTPTNWKETQTQTPTNWKETETQTPTNWKEEVTGLQADNQADANNSIYAFNSSNPVKISESQSKVSSKSTTERLGTFETETERTGTFETETERTGTFETETERTGTFETEKERTGTFETETEHTGTFETATVHSGTFETETERTGTFETETERTGTFETETERTGTYETETQHTGTYEKETEYDTELKRSGNIGVTTSQQMITSERELWMWHFFQNVVFPDICKVLALSIY